MALSEKMLSLQEAMNRYSDATITHYRAIHAFGDAIVTRLPIYLGEGAEVLGVPPEGDFRTNGGDYHDAKFTTYGNGTLKITPIQMGIAVGIPRTTKGAFWARIVVEFEMREGTISSQVGDGSAIHHAPLENNGEYVERVCESIYQYIKSVFDDPVAAALAVKRGRLGFI